jgi:hypothetical protein
LYEPWEEIPGAFSMENEWNMRDYKLENFENEIKT